MIKGLYYDNTYSPLVSWKHQAVPHSGSHEPLIQKPD
jgi:hypothetical protein